MQQLGRESNATLGLRAQELAVAGSLRSGQRAANIMTLIQSAKLNGLDPYAYLSDVLKRLPTHKVTQIEELLPHCWKPEPN